MAAPLFAVGALVGLLVVLIAVLLVHSQGHSVSAIAAINGATPGLEVVAAYSGKAAALVGKTVTLSYKPASGNPITVKSTVYAVFDSTGAYTGPAPAKTLLPTPPPAGSVIVQFASPPAASMAGFPSGASVYSSLTSGAKIVIG
jgi:hypothetical protein